MKKIFFFACVGASLLFFVNASVWEGVAQMSEDLPEIGRYVKTNSFPVNTVVDVTNLENGRIARFIVSSGMDSSGFLALLSKDAADVLGIGKGSVSRIKMVQNEDPFAISRFFEENEGMFYVPSSDGTEGTFRLPGSERFSDFELVPSELRSPEARNGSEPNPDAFISGLKPVQPETNPVPDPASFISGVNPVQTPVDPKAFAPIIPSITIPQITQTAPLPAVIEPVPAAERRIEPAPVTPVISSPFSAPLITGFEKGKYYIQIGAYSKPETVRAEISKIDNKLPVSLMQIGTAEKPIYRIIIGPVNLGESGALLQRFKVNYKDAFVRVGT